MKALINQLRTKIWTQVFVIYLRYLIGGAFTYSSVVKIMGQRFTSTSGENDPINTPFHFFETLYQTGLYWQFLGWGQLIAAFLLMTQRFAKLGALIFFPIILNIFVITISINFSYTFIITGFMLLANSFLLIWHIDELKFLINLKPHFECKTRFENKKIWEITGFILFIITLCFRIFTIKYDLILWFFLCIIVGIISLFIGLRKKLPKNDSPF